MNPWMRKLLGWTRRRRRVRSGDGGAVVVEVGAVGGADFDAESAPERAMISGMRKPSPISTSSPRETMTSPPEASSLRARKMAAALLLTTIPEAPRSRSSRPAMCTSRLPRRPAARSYSRLE